MGKINDIEKLSVTNSNTIVNLISNNQKIKSDVINANITQYDSNILHVVESQWINFTMLKLADGSENILNQYITFETTFEQFPENLIPYISSNIVINQVDDVPSVSFDFDVNLYLHKDELMYFDSLNDGFAGNRWGDLNGFFGINNFQVEDIEGSTLKRVTVVTMTRVIGTVSSILGLYPQFQGKLVLLINNPNNFSRIT